jgi:endogenous inhibitor of DNA gyrase (YacG/DUF329 family)
MSSVVNQYPCPNCGANTVFAPGTDGLLCSHCNTNAPIPRATAPLEELPFDDHATTIPANAQAEVGAKEIECKTCGARVMAAKQTQRCPFCDSAMVIELPAEPTIAPQGVLPFAITGSNAQELFIKWLSTRWFAPFKLVAKAKRDGMDGVYLPYWTFDAETDTNYRGERGEHYYDTEYYTDAEGKRQSRQVRRTRWYDASGNVHVSFDDILVQGTASLPRELVEKLEPWDLHDLRAFDGKYLAGFIAERSSVPVKAGHAVAVERMEPKILGTIRNDIGGDEQRIHDYSVARSQETWKHVMLPLWISAFRFGEQVYRVTVNARTGEVSGERPYSTFKIVMAVLFGLAIIVAMFMLVQRP